MSAEAGGALVALVQPESPAARAGIAPGSVIAAVEGTRIERASDLVAALSQHGEGEQLTVTLRTGPQQTEEVSLLVGIRPTVDEAEVETAQPDGERPRLGVAVVPLSREMRSELGLPADLDGLVVSRVEEGSPAAAANIVEGDVIVAADQTPAAGVEALREAAARAGEEGRPLLLRIYKEGTYSFIPVELGPT